MKVIGVFNVASSENIGLENLLSRGLNIECELITLDQSSRCARHVLEREYPHSAKIEINSAREMGFFGLFRDIFRKSRKQRVILHAHHARSVFFAGLCAFIPSVVIVCTVHSNFRAYRLDQKVLFIIGFLLARHVVCNSGATQNSLPLVINRKKTSVIYNGVNFEKLDAAVKGISKQPSDCAVVVGTACRMVAAKDLPTLVSAFAVAVKISEIPIRLKLIGDGPERPKIRRLMLELGIEDYVQFTGKLSRQQVYANITEVDIFAVTSKWEGFCNAMVEAAAAGLAIVASNVDPLPEVIGAGNAVFFEPGQVRDLGVLIACLASDEERRQDLGCKARSFVRHRYALRASASRYRRLYESLLPED